MPKGRRHCLVGELRAGVLCALRFGQNVSKGGFMNRHYEKTNERPSQFTFQLFRTSLPQLFYRSDRQIMNTAFVVLVTGNRHLIFHSADDAIRDGLVVLWRQQDIHGAGSLLDEGYGDSFFRTRLRAFLMAGAVSAHDYVAERIFKRSVDTFLGSRGDRDQRQRHYHAEKSSEHISTHTAPRRTGVHP